MRIIILRSRLSFWGWDFRLLRVELGLFGWGKGKEGGGWFGLSNGMGWVERRRFDWSGKGMDALDGMGWFW